MGLIATDRIWAPVFCFWGPRVSVKRFFGVFFSIELKERKIYSHTLEFAIIGNDCDLTVIIVHKNCLHLYVELERKNTPQ